MSGNTEYNSHGFKYRSSIKRATGTLALRGAPSRRPAQVQEPVDYVAAWRRWDMVPYNPVWQQKEHRRCFYKKIWIIKNNSLCTEPTTKNHLTDSSTPNWHRIDLSWDPTTALLPSILPASDCTAKPPSSICPNGLTISNHTLYERNEYEKAVPKHFNGFEPSTREKARASIWTDAHPNCASRRNCYTTSELSARPIYSISNLVFTK